MNFVTVKAQRPDEVVYDTYLNSDYINYIVPSSQSQVGNSIIHMVLPPPAPLRSNPKATYPVIEDLAALKMVFPKLVEAEVFSTSSQSATVPVLINLARVREIIRRPKFASLIFVDGDELTVDQMPI